jgi:hypothetical protein
LTSLNKIDCHSMWRYCNSDGQQHHTNSMLIKEEEDDDDSKTAARIK